MMETFSELKALSKNSFSLLSKIFQLIRLELALAEKTAFRVMILIFILMIFITGTWLCGLALLIIYLTSLGVRLEFCLIGTGLAHILLCLVTALSLRKYSKDLTFPATRKHLRYSSSEKNTHHQRNP